MNTVADSSCRHCRRPIHLAVGVGWLHGELPQYAHEPITCERPEPVEWGSRRLIGHAPHLGTAVCTTCGEPWICSPAARIITEAGG